MAAESWLEDELAELDEAEQFIQQTMSEFVPSRHISDSNSRNVQDQMFSDTKQVTNSLPKSPKSPGVDKITNHFFSDLQSDKKQRNTSLNQFTLPPPPEVDNFVSYQKEETSQISPKFPSPPTTCSIPSLPNQSLPPPSTRSLPSPSYFSNSRPSDSSAPPPYSQVKRLSSEMSKAPPPVLPKPVRSTPTLVKTGIGSVTMQINNSRSPKSPSSQTSFSNSMPPPPVSNYYPSQSSFSSPPPVSNRYPSPSSFPPPPEPVSDLPLPPPPSAAETSPKDSPSRGIPKNIEKNSMDELDFLTNNLLLNMENPKDEEFYGYCEKCGGVVEGENVGCNAMGKIYHIGCFDCASCGCQLHGSPFYAVNKKPYCEACHMASLEKCTVCSKVITERILRAMGKPFCPECFKCSVAECGKTLDGVPFTTDDSNNIYCVDCYHRQFAFRCCVCDKPILPEPGKAEALRIVAMEKNYHMDCYKCEDCGIKFSSDEKCYPIDDHIYCVNCSAERLQHVAA